MFRHIKPTAATRGAVEPRSDQRFSTTLAHGFEILQSFRLGQPLMSNRDLVERTGLSKASVSRLTYTLAELGFLKYDLQMRMYRLGSAALAVGYPLMASLPVRQIARPLMRALAEQVGGSVSLGMRDRDAMVYLETSRGHDAIAFRPDIGASLPMISTAMGRGWLAGVTDDERDAALARLRRSDPTGWRRHARGLRASLATHRSRGFCPSRGEWQADMHAVSVPMKRRIDGEVLVFNCGFPIIGAPAGKLDADVGPRLAALVERVDALMDATAS